MKLIGSCMDDEATLETATVMLTLPAIACQRRRIANAARVRGFESLPVVVSNYVLHPPPTSGDLPPKRVRKDVFDMPHYKERNNAIFEEYNAGDTTYAELVRKYGLCRDRIRQIVIRENRRSKSPLWTDDLSPRVVHVLSLNGIHNKHDLRNRLPELKRDMKMIRNFGEKSLAEVCKFLNEPLD